MDNLHTGTPTAYTPFHICEFPYILLPHHFLELPQMVPLNLFKCLSDETRLYTTLLIFKHGELCVCELTALLNESQPKISRHLAQLKKCKVLTDRRKEQWVYYNLHPAMPDWAKQVVTNACLAESSKLQQLLTKLNTQVTRPARC